MIRGIFDSGFFPESGFSSVVYLTHMTLFPNFSSVDYLSSVIDFEETIDFLAVPSLRL
jgi:hypothetical protein